MMWKHKLHLFVSVLIWLLLGFLLQNLTVVYTSSPTIKNPDEFVASKLKGSGPETVDPAWCYAYASEELILSVYETLIFFDGERVERFIPQLATLVPTLENGLIQNVTGEVSSEGLPWYFRYVFPIRTGVKFHNNSLWGEYTLTPQDVEYSFERAMVQDRNGGPQWMLYEPLLNTLGAEGLGNLSNPEDVIKIGRMIDHAVESNSTHVWFNLAFPGAYAPFLQILSQAWSSVLSKQWVNDYVIGTLSRPEWNGEWGDYTDWVGYHDPDKSPLDDPTPVMCGTGPYQLETLDFANEYWSIVRFADYWRGWPADWPAPPYPAGYVNRVKVTWAYDWTTRRDMFLNGDLDFCHVPREYKDEIIGQPGIRCTYPLPRLIAYGLFFTFDIDPLSPYGIINDPGVFTEDGIPSDFFGNSTWGVHVRKAFAYAFDYDAFLETVFEGEGVQPPTAIVPGLPYYDPTTPKYTYNLTKAEEEFKKVPNLWDTGFTIHIPYSYGYPCSREVAAELLKTALESINPLFHVMLVNVWEAEYSMAMGWHKLPVFLIGWGADYPDPHDFTVPFYHSEGVFAKWQKYGNSTMDDLIDAGIRELDPTARRQIYRNVQMLAHQDVPSIVIFQTLERHFERDWVQGWYYNPVYPGLYFYPLWKQERIQGDVNYDDTVDMKDIGFICRAFGSHYGPPLHPRWNFRCDVNNDRKIDMKDIGYAAIHYGSHT